MALIHCDFMSASLGMATAMNVVLPETIPVSEAPVIYLLHGLSDDCTGWSRYTASERYAREHDAVLVMPEVQRSFYANMEHGISYFDYIAEELPDVCRRFFGVSVKREQNFIMGLSMGGYGALKCALTNPQRYAGAASFSGVIDMQERVERAPLGEQREFAAIFGEQLLVPRDCDLHALSGALSKEDFLPVRLYCGEEDGLFPENEAFAAELAQRGMELSFEHWKGGHEWSFWDEALRRAMDAFLGGNYGE